MAFNFEQKIQELKRARSTLPIIIGNMAKRHFVKSFRDGGFTDEAFNPWQSRKRSDRNQKTRAILVKTGHLRNSIRVRVANYNKIEIGSYNIPYAVFHNKGVGKMPKRQFIGQSSKLSKEIMKRISKEIKEIL
jgi:phage gpG-like protein